MSNETTPAASRGRSATWPLPLAVFAVAFAVRALTLLQERVGNPLFLEPILDDRAYLRLADGLRDPAAAARPWFLAPLHPWLLAAASAGGAATMAVAGWLSAATGAMTAALAAVAARELHSTAAGWAAGLLYAAAGVVVFSETLPGQEPTLGLLHVAALLLAVLWLRRGTWPYAAAFGVVVGAAVLGRALSGTLGIAFAAVALVRVRPRGRALAAVAVAALGAVAALVPAAVRNAREFGDFTPLPWSAGPNLYLANGPFSRQFTAFASREIGLDPDAMERQAAEIAERAAGRALRPSEISSYWTKRTWDERGTAAETALHCGRKAALFWSASEIANNHDVALERRWSAWLSVVPVSSWWIFALGVGGWWIARRRAPELDFAAIAFVLTWAALVVYFPVSRYKLPLVPLAVVAVGCGVGELIGGVPRRRALAAAAMVAAALGLTWVGTTPALHATGAANLAVMFAARGEAKKGVELLRDTLAHERNDGAAVETLGRILLDDGEPAAALVEFEGAQARGRWSAGLPAIRALVELRRPDAARELARSLIGQPMSPGYRAELLANFALADLASGDRPQAVAHLRAAEAIDPAAPAVTRAREALSR